MSDDEIISTWQRVCEFPDASGRLLTITREDALQVSRALLAAEREAAASVCDRRAENHWVCSKSPIFDHIAGNIRACWAEAEACGIAIRSRT